MSYKLFIPGPVNVSKATYEAMATPLVGHRSPDFVQLSEEIKSHLYGLFYSKDPVFFSTSSAWGAMEASVRNLCGKRVLNCMCGAFSDKWYDVCQRAGLACRALRSEWGQPIEPNALRKALESETFDVVTLVHNETSTGLMNPLEELMAVMREFPGVCTVLDTVSSFSAVPIEKDRLGIDVVLTGTQKALALPPGLALLSVSERALKRAETIPNRGYYFDFLEFLKNEKNGMTPTTPNISLLYGLRHKLKEISKEGLPARYLRHERLNAKVHAWVEDNGFELFPDKAYAAKTLSCIKNNREIDIPDLIERLKQKFNCVIDGGYGKIKGRTFRISNMGDETDETMGELLQNLNVVLSDMGHR